MRFLGVFHYEGKHSAIISKTVRPTEKDFLCGRLRDVPYPMKIEKFRCGKVTLEDRIFCTGMSRPHLEITWEARRQHECVVILSIDKPPMSAVNLPDDFIYDIG